MEEQERTTSAARRADQGPLAEVSLMDVPTARQATVLDEAVHTAEALTVAAYDQAIDAGRARDQARELVREKWAFLPDEDDV